MKNYFSSKTMIAVATAIAIAAGYENLVNAQSIPPPASGGTLPAGITPGTPTAEVVKLAQAGVDAGVIQNYINSCPNAFNVTADEIIALTDAGVSSDMVNAMMAHDKNLPAAATPPASPAPTDNPETVPPPAPVTQVDFDNSLSPYGQWIQVDGYGRCWRPTTVVYDATWQPYCDRGRWVYTDCGWYWDSDYSWGVTFHYGRWFHHDNYGWCWWPETVWAPSWVTWRSSGTYCGWAPLPPYTVYQPGIGFTYRGGNVAVSFGFGLSANCFTFVSVGNFCQPHPRNYCVPRQQVTQIYNQTTIINNYNYYSHNHTIVNNGVPVTTIGAATHRTIQPVSVNSLANSRNHGWPAGNPTQNLGHYGGGSAASPNNFGGGHAENNRVPTQRNGNGGDNYNNNYYHQNTGVSTGHRPPFNPSPQPVNHSGETVPPSHPQNNNGAPPSSNHPEQHQPGWSGRNDNNPSALNSQSLATAHPHNNYAPVAGNHSQTPEAQPYSGAPAQRNVAPAASTVAVSTPANSGGRNQNWPTQNH